MKTITKRNGKIESYNPEKIKNALNAAFQSVYGTDCPEHVFTYADFLASKKNTVEEIQNEVEYALFKKDYFDVAKAYIKYRESRKNARFIKERLDYMDTYSDSSDNAASSSETDANANVSIKNVANLEGEVYKSTNRIIQRQRMKEKLNELYPEVAKQYEKDLNNHIIYAHDEASSPAVKNYCMAATLYPLMVEGTGNIDGITPNPPNDIQSFSGQVTNLVFLLSSQVRGAVALGDYFVALNYYVVAEFGEDWFDHLNDIISSNTCLYKKTIKDAIRKGMKQFIYGVSQPAGNRSYNSPFSNLNFFDKYYFEEIFKDYYYPDGTTPKWKAIDILQRIFIELHRELRLIKPLTFPVTTLCAVHDNNDWLDQEYKQLCADELSKGSSFFIYLSDSVSSISSCCFSKDTKFLWKSSTSGVNLTTFEEFYNTPYSCNKENYKLFHNGSWIKGKVIKLPSRPMYKVTTYNNKEFIMTDNHINVTYDGEKPTSNLTVNDYLLFNTSTLNAIPEKDENLTYAQGILVGLFIGDGSFGNYICQDNSVHSFQLSLNKEKWEKTKDILSILGEFKLGNIYNNVYPIKCCNKELTTFISKWTTNDPLNTHSYNKSLNLNCLLQSKEFRRGILDGWYITDGGNSNRCYTTSKTLVERMELLCTSLGLQTIINLSDRTDEDVIIRGISYTRNYPLYCLRWFEDGNHRTNKDVNKSWKKKNNGLYWKIKSIEPIEYNENVYCIECANQDEPYFTLPSGLITHNCRVQNEIKDNTFSSTTGLTGIMTGSSNVISLNFNRIVQDWYKQLNTSKTPEEIGVELIDNESVQNSLKEYLTEILKRVYKYQITFKTLLYEAEDKKMFSSSNAGYIYTKKLFSTIGFIGYCEASEFFGYKVNYNQNYVKFVQLLLGTISEQNKLHSVHDKKRPCIFNSEGIPGEALAEKFYNWDKNDGYKVPEDQNLYSSYFFKQWDPNISVLDKLKLHGKEIAKYCDGGQACHIHLDSHLSKDQYLKLLEYNVHNGVSYTGFNIPISECKDCGHVVNAPIKICPKCQSENIDYWVRIIGFLRPLSSYSNGRFKEAQKRVYVNSNKVIK